MVGEIEEGIRRADTVDYNTLGQIMFEAVRVGASDYSEAQKSAWVPLPRCGEEWHRRLDKQFILVYVQNETINAFMSLTAEGYIDFAYVRPKMQRQGVFRRLYNEVESRAINAGQKSVWVHASLMAQPAFSAMGFSIVKEEYIAIDDQRLRRFEMKKNLL